MLVGDDDIREKHLLSFYQTGKQQLHERDSLNVPRGSLLFDPGGVFQKRGGVHIGEGAVPEGRITKAVIVCQTGQAGGNIYGSSRGLVTVKLEQFVGFVANRLTIQFRHQQPPTAMNQIMLLRSTWMQVGSSTSTTSEHLTADVIEHAVTEQTGRM